MFHYIGIDVSKQTLHLFDGQREHSFPNEPQLAAFDHFLTTHQPTDGEWVIIFEPTGAYSSYLRSYCARKGLKTHILHPLQSSYFAKAQGYRSKTDPIDARMLYATHRMLEPSGFQVPQVSVKVRQLGAWLSTYALLVKTEIQWRNHQQAGHREESADLALLGFLEEQEQVLKEKKASLLKTILQWLRQDEDLVQAMDHLCSIPGVGTITALHLLHLFMKYPVSDRNQLTALAGLDPVVKSSGTSLHQQASISKRGSHLLRRVLYCAAMTGVQHHPAWKLKYQGMVERGKVKNIGIVTIMRKILLHAYAVYREQRYYEDRSQAHSQKENAMA